MNAECLCVHECACTGVFLRRTEVKEVKSCIQIPCFSEVNCCPEKRWELFSHLSPSNSSVQPCLLKLSERAFRKSGSLGIVIVDLSFIHGESRLRIKDHEAEAQGASWSWRHRIMSWIQSVTVPLPTKTTTSDPYSPDSWSPVVIPDCSKMSITVPQPEAIFWRV